MASIKTSALAGKSLHSQHQQHQQHTESPSCQYFNQSDLNSSKMDHMNKSLVDYSFTESCLDDSFNQSCLPLVDYPSSEIGDAVPVASTPPLDILRSHLAAMKTTTYGVAYSPRRRERIERRLLDTMETEKGKEERRKTNIIQAASMTSGDADAFNRGCTRRTSLKSGGKSRPLKRLVGTLRSTPRIPRRQSTSAVLQLLQNQCFKPMD